MSLPPSLEAFRSAWDAVEDGIVITEAEPLSLPGPRILYVNPALERMTGYACTELIGRTPRILQGPDTDQEVCAYMGKKLRAWEPVRATLKNYRKDGEPFFVELSITPVTNPDGWVTHWISVQRDVTDAVLAKEQVEQQRQDLLSVMDNCGAGVFAVDENGIVTFANDQVLQWLDVERERGIGQSIWDLIPSLHGSELSLAMTRCRETGQSQTVRDYIPEIDRHFKLNYLMLEDHVFCFAYDVTDLEKSLRELRQQHEKLSFLMESFGGGLWTCDFDYRYTYANSRINDLGGFPIDEIIGKTCWELYPSLRESKFGPALIECMENRVSVVVEDFVAETGRYYRTYLYPTDQGMSVFVHETTEIEKSKRALAEEQENTRFLMESFGGLMWTCDKECRFTSVTDRLLETVNLPMDKVLGQVVWQFYPSLAHSGLKQSLEAVIRYKEPSTDLSFVPELDRYFRSYLYPNGDGVVGFSHDVTELERSQRDLSEERSRMQQAQALAQVATFAWNLNTGVVKHDPYLLSMFGLEEDESGHSLKQYTDPIHEKDQTQRQFLEGLHLSPQSYDIQYRIDHPRSGIRWIRDFGQFVDGDTPMIFGATQDITEYVEAQDRLRLSEREIAGLLEENQSLLSELQSYARELEERVMERTESLEESRRELESILDAAPQAIFVTDSVGQILFMNRSSLRFLAIKEKGQFEFDLLRFQTKTQERVATIRFRRGLKGEKPFEGAVSLKSTEAERVFFDYRGEPLRDRSGEISKWIFVAADVTQRVEAIRRQQRANRQLESAKSELEAFSYSVSHDLRAPLRGIDGFAQALDEDFGGLLPDEGKRYLGVIRSECHRLSTLIDELLRLSQVSKQDVQTQEINLSELVRETWTLVKKDSGSLAEISVQPRMKIEADRHLAQILLMNLLSNAAKFSSRNPEARISVGMKRNPGGRVFSVEDNGVGFDPRFAGQIFQPFQRLHRMDEFPGTGIGLATVQRIAEKHGWTVKADAKPGEGAKFTVFLDGEPN